MTKFKIGDKVRCNDFHFERHTSVYSFDNKYNVMEVVDIDGKLVECKVNGGIWNYWENELELAKVLNDMTFKSGDKVEGKRFGRSDYVIGKVIGIDYDDPQAMYLVGTSEGTYWLETSTVELIEEEEDRSTYDKLLKFVNENDISIATVNEVVKHLDKIEKLDVDIENTKKLWEQHEDEAQRLFDKLSKLEKERSELQNKTTD